MSMRNTILWTTLLVSSSLVCGAAEEGPHTLQFSMRTTGEYTDNRDSSALQKESTFDLTLAPRGDVRLEREGDLLEFYYEPAYRYRSNPGIAQHESALFHNASLQVDHEFGPRSKIEARELFSYTDDPAVDEGGRTVRESGSFYQNRLEGTYSYNLTASSYLDLSGFNIIKRYDEARAAVNEDEDASRIGATYWHQVDGRLALLGLLEAATYGFNSVGVDRDSDAFFVGVGLYRVLANNMRLDVRAGADTMKFSDSALGSDTQPRIDASLVSNAKARTRVRLGAGLEKLARSGLAPFASEDREYVQGSVEHDLSPKITLRGGLQYSRSKYDAIPRGAPVGTAGGSEELVEAKAGVEYKVDDKNRLRLDGTYQDAQSDVSVNVPRGYTRSAGSLSWLIKL